MTDNIVSLKPVDSAKNDDAITLVEGLLERLRSGESVAVGFVEVKRGDTVATAWSTGGTYYHQLNSGAVVLSTRLASAT